jgi:hypothetical protein
MDDGMAINHRELERYLARVGDRWPIERAYLGGARVDDERGLGPQRERGPEYVIILVSEGFAGTPWLERVYVAGNLWDASEMGDYADVHCYTPDEMARKEQTLKRVQRAVEHGIDLLAPPPPPGTGLEPEAQPSA